MTRSLLFYYFACIRPPLGRVAWLFRVRSGFLEYALELQNNYNVTGRRILYIHTYIYKLDNNVSMWIDEKRGLGQDKSNNAVSSAIDLSSEDQFRSG